MLTGAHVTLRAATEADLDPLFEIAAELETWEQRTARPPRPLSRPEFADRFRTALSEPDDDVSFVIEAEGKVVGRCDLFGFDTLSRHAELGIGLAPAARSHGYGTDAVRVLVRFAFERRNLHRVHLSVLATNAAALACYRKVGFVEEGRRREVWWVRGSYVDDVLMGLLRSEWRP
jgi:RimJ/RimL family protein N-acetyltransferase